MVFQINNWNFRKLFNGWLAGKNLHTISNKNGPKSLRKHADSQRPSLDDPGPSSMEQFVNCGHLLQDFEKLPKTEPVNE